MITEYSIVLTKNIRASVILPFLLQKYCETETALTRCDVVFLTKEERLEFYDEFYRREAQDPAVHGNDNEQYLPLRKGEALCSTIFGLLPI